MTVVMIFLVCISIFVIGFAMVGYPLLLVLLDKLFAPKDNEKDYSYKPDVSYMIVAHNEEKVIADKLKNALEIDYPANKLQIIVASDNSTDKTNEIVSELINANSDKNINLYCSQEHKGKTNAQNEAQKLATGEILVMTDANTMIKSNAITELVASFTSADIAYVCGKLVYSNADDNSTSQSESTYWNLDLKLRDIESRFSTITAGNGAIYACRNSEYIDFNPISCHDSAMPYTYSKIGKRAIFNPDAIAVEKAGETDGDEFKRKVRMNRDILDMLSWGIAVLNPFKYRWFALFYFGHRTCRYSLWWAHIILLLSTLILGIQGNIFFGCLFVLQMLFIVMALLSLVLNNSVLRMAGYYAMTVYAQIVGVFNIVTGKSKPVWEKAESTR